MRDENAQKERVFDKKILEDAIVDSRNFEMVNKVRDSRVDIDC